MRPLIEVQGYKLRAVIAPDALGRSAFAADTPKYVDELRRFEAEIHLESDALATKDIDYGQKSDLGTLCKDVMHEIHGPALIGRSRLRGRIAHGRCAGDAGFSCGWTALLRGKVERRA
jgi:hypothetical protein